MPTPPAASSSSDQEHPLRVDDYAEVVDTRDEWEGLIGVVEEFLDEDDQPVRANSPRVAQVVIHIPTRPDGQNALRLREINELTSYVRAQLRAEDDRRCFTPKQLAWLDPRWL